jgi:hypothetical protein
MTEKALQAAVVKYARQRRWLVYHTYDSRRSAPGFPDLVLVRAFQVIFAELKTDKGKLTKDQDEWREALLEADQRWFLWRPSHLEAVFKLLA